MADTSLRDTENVPLKEDIKAYFEREVLPFAPDARIQLFENFEQMPMVEKTTIRYIIIFSQFLRLFHEIIF